MVKDYLTDKGIHFEEIDLFEYPDKRQEMEKISKQKNIPVLLINDEVVIGWQKEKIDEILKRYDAI